MAKFLIGYDRRVINKHFQYLSQLTFDLMSNAGKDEIEIISNLIQIDQIIKGILDIGMSELIGLP
jgi:hypothetical protein